MRLSTFDAGNRPASPNPGAVIREHDTGRWLRYAETGVWEEVAPCEMCGDFLRVGDDAEHVRHAEGHA